MNQLKVNQRQTIVSLREQGWSKRKIARELALDRATVRKIPGGQRAKITHPAIRVRQNPGGKITRPPANRLGLQIGSGQFV